jgi:hypothetical protein
MGDVASTSDEKGRIGDAGLYGRKSRAKGGQGLMGGRLDRGLSHSLPGVKPTFGA